MLTAYIISILCMIGGVVSFWRYEGPPPHLPYPVLLFSAGLLLLVMCFGGVAF